MIELYNTYTKKKEPFITQEKDKVSMYVCGPTVYNDPHIGNARPLAVFDTLKKVLEADGYTVTYVSNYTDVDDKIIAAAKEKNISEKELTEFYIKEFERLEDELHVKRPDITPKASETIDQIIVFVSELIEKGAAYEANGDVYYRIDSNPQYGELTKLSKDDLQVGARIEENEQKENPLDFALWKKTEEGIRWDSPWSKGRPGWHTECVVMINDVFGKHSIDLHGGGMDLKFPHHENEMAQNRSLYDLPLANFWVYNGMINIDRQKMSKSLGNVWLIKDVLQHCSGNALRWLLLSTHYRAPLNLTETSISNAQKEVDKLEQTWHKANMLLLLNHIEKTREIDQELFEKFLAPLKDDLGTPNAITALFSLQKEINQVLRKRDIDFERLGILLNTYQKECSILGIEFEKITLSKEEEELYQQWKEASQAKDYERSDALRKILMEKGIL